MPRLLSVLYTIGFWVILGTALSRVLFGNLPPGFEGRRIRYLAQAFVLAIVWPLGLLTPNGRRLLQKSLPS